MGVINLFKVATLGRQWQLRYLLKLYSAMKTLLIVAVLLGVHGVLGKKKEKELKEDNNRAITAPANPNCYHYGAKALGFRLKGEGVGHIKVDRPEMCQYHCQRETWCMYWTYQEEDHKLNKRKKRRCYLMFSHTSSKKRHGFVWGPKMC